MTTEPTKSIIVTGAGSGIGRAVSRALLQAGHKVTLAGRRKEALIESASSSAALIVPTDVTDAAQVEALFAAHHARFGGLDVLFNNAGTFGPTADVGELDIHAWNHTFAVNVTGMMLCAGAAFRAMSAQPTGGRIINNASISAQTPRPRSVAYTTTKHAVAGLSKSIELDGRRYRITCTQLDIGNAKTELITQLGTSTGALQADGSVKIEPMMDAGYVANLVTHLVDLPVEVSVPHLVATAAGMPFVGRG